MSQTEGGHQQRAWGPSVGVFDLQPAQAGPKSSTILAAFSTTPTRQVRCDADRLRLQCKGRREAISATAEHGGAAFRTESGQQHLHAVHRCAATAICTAGRGEKSTQLCCSTAQNSTRLDGGVVGVAHEIQQHGDAAPVVAQHRVKSLIGGCGGGEERAREAGASVATVSGGALQAGRAQCVPQRASLSGLGAGHRRSAIIVPQLLFPNYCSWLSTGRPPAAHQSVWRRESRPPALRHDPGRCAAGAARPAPPPPWRRLGGGGKGGIRLSAQAERGWGPASNWVQMCTMAPKLRLHPAPTKGRGVALIGQLVDFLHRRGHGRAQRAAPRCGGQAGKQGGGGVCKCSTGLA